MARTELLCRSGHLRITDTLGLLDFVPNFDKFLPELGGVEFELINPRHRPKIWLFLEVGFNQVLHDLADDWATRFRIGLYGGVDILESHFG